MTYSHDVRSIVAVIDTEWPRSSVGAGEVTARDNSMKPAGHGQTRRQAIGDTAHSTSLRIVG